VFLPASARPEPGCDCGRVVQVWVDGFGQPLLLNEGTPAQQEQGPIRLDEIVPNLPALLEGAMETLLSTRFSEPHIDFDPLARGISQVAHGVLGHMQLDEHGNSIEPISRHWAIDPEQCHITDSQFSFRFDYRQCPFEIASQLNEFIEALVEHTGHQTIALTGHSQGAVIAMTYLALYGPGRLETLVLTNGAWQGLSLVGRLFSGHFALESQSVANALGLDESNRLVSTLLGAIPHVSNFVINTIMEPAFDHFLIPVFAQMPAVWSFVPPEYFEAALRNFGNDPRLAHALASATRYQTEVLARSEELLAQAMESGVHIAVIASYNHAPIPVSRNATYHSDGLIGTARMSGGATVAPFGQTLPPGDSRHRSPDGVIDAATALLPNSTWFVRDNDHSEHAMYELRTWIVNASTQPTVWQNPDFPQFLIRTEDGRAVPLR